MSSAKALGVRWHAAVTSIMTCAARQPAELPHRVRLPSSLQGAMTDERVPQEALVQTGVSLGSAVGGEPQQQAALYASLDDAQAGAVAVAGAAAQSATEGYASAVRLQQMMGQVGHPAPLKHKVVLLSPTDCCKVVYAKIRPTSTAL